jgi:nicotinate-nucleotide adenylyltransferase
MRIGIFGGTFDPPHLGHLILAEESVWQLKLDYLLWVLTPVSPFKENLIISPIQDRISMVLLAITGNQQFKFSPIDLDRPPPHYAVDTLALLRQASPQDEFYYLMGADSLNDLSAWHKPAEFISHCHGVGVVLRHGESINVTKLGNTIPGLSTKLILLETPIIQISGSDIRARVQKGREFRYFVPDSVYQYIVEHNLYKS